MATSKRNVRIHFRLTEEEADKLIETVEKNTDLNIN